LGGEVLQGAAQCQHLVNAGCAVFHGSIACAQQGNAVCQTDLTGFNAMCGRVARSFVGARCRMRVTGMTGMVCMAGMVVSTGERSGGGEGNSSGAADKLTTVHKIESFLLGEMILRIIKSIR
jgi:hypothetical protein